MATASVAPSFLCAALYIETRKSQNIVQGFEAVGFRNHCRIFFHYSILITHRSSKSVYRYQIHISHPSKVHYLPGFRSTAILCTICSRSRKLSANLRSLVSSTLVDCFPNAPLSLKKCPAGPLCPFDPARPFEPLRHDSRSFRQVACSRPRFGLLQGMRV